MSACTRERRVAGSVSALKRLGPRSPITALWMRSLMSANGSRWTSGGRRTGGDRCESSISAASPRALARRTEAAAEVGLAERPQRATCVRAGLALHDRLGRVDRAGNVPVARDHHIGLAPRDRLGVIARNADPAVRPVQHELDPLGLHLHQRERLEAELGVLERGRVEHPDHADVGRGVDCRDDLGREARRGVDHDPLLTGAKDVEQLAQELGSDGAGLVGADGCEQDPGAGFVREAGTRSASLRRAIRPSARDRRWSCPARARAPVRRRRIGDRGPRARRARRPRRGSRPGCTT